MDDKFSEIAEKQSELN